MDIVNVLPAPQFEIVDDFLAFISIYDDKNRLRAYREMLSRHREEIAGKVCVDAGCGYGFFSEWMVQLGAGKVYAVESNPLLFQMARQRLEKFTQVVMVHDSIQNFQPSEPVDVLVHEFFGQLLYDEDLWVLENLSFRPKTWLPNRAVLKYGITSSRLLVDEAVPRMALEKLNGVLVSGLFDEGDLPLTDTVLEWKPHSFTYTVDCNINGKEGDLMYFGIEIFDNNQMVCRSGDCSNWSYVWTPRTGNVFQLSFQRANRGMDVIFRWLDEKSERNK